MQKRALASGELCRIDPSPTVEIDMKNAFPLSGGGRGDMHFPPVPALTRKLYGKLLVLLVQNMIVIALSEE